MEPIRLFCHPSARGRVFSLVTLIPLILVGFAVGDPVLAQMPSLDPDTPLADLMITRWTVDEGLPTNSLLRLGQSLDGYLWASAFSVLIRFDGLDFRIFDRSDLPYLTTDGFTSLHRDRLGRFWIGTRGDGLLTYERGRFEPFGEPLESRAAIMDLLLDRRGRLWIGVDDLGAYRFDGSRPVPLPYPSVRRITVGVLAQDAEGAVWIGTHGKGLTRVLGGEATTFISAEGMPVQHVSGLEADQRGLWVAGKDGLARFQDGSLRPVDGLEGIPLGPLLQDPWGSLWIGGPGGLVRRRGRTGEIEKLTQIEGEPLRGIIDLFLDREDSLWIATFNGGLIQLRNSAFKNFTPEDGLESAVIDTICERTPGEYWIGTYTGAVQVLRDERITQLDLPEGKAHGRVRHIYRDRDDSMWIAFDAGLLHWRDDRKILYTADDGLPLGHPRVTFRDSAGRLWAGTSLGVAQLRDDGRFEPLEGEVRSRFVLSIREDLEGRLLISTRGHLFVHSPGGETRAYTAEEGLPGSVVFNTLTDDDGTIWLATNGGLGRLKNGRIHTLDKRHGLPVDSVFDIKIDDRGSFWLSSAVGLIRLAGPELRAYMEGRIDRVEPRVFDHRDGMVNRECVGARKMLQTEDGRLWVPTLGGIARLDPDRLPADPPPPPVTVDLLRVDGEPIDLPEEGSVTLEPDPQRIELGFDAPSFVAPDRVQLFHTLVGFDSGWIETGTERTASYTNLEPGEYTFRARAVDRTTAWPAQTAELLLVIRPAFHQTPFFYILVAGLGVLGVVGLFRRRVEVIQRRNDQLKQNLAEQKQVEREKERLIDELETKNRQLEQLGYSFSHDLKTPLVSIRGFLGLLEEDVAAGHAERMREDMEQIRHATDCMSRLLNGLQELTSLTRPEGEIQTLELDFLVEAALGRLAPILEERRATVETIGDLPSVIGRRDHLVRALYHLVDNAAKFAVEGDTPRIEIGVRRGEREPVYFVRDHGIGIEPAHHESIFGLFHRLDQSREGVGIGLVVVERVIRAHAGEVWVESEGAGRGSTFCFTLGLRRPAA